MRTFQRCCSVLLLVSTVAAAGCATQDRRDAPWDPKREQTLFDQMPNWAETTLWLRRDVDLKVHPQPVQSLEEVRAHP